MYLRDYVVVIAYNPLEASAIGIEKYVVVLAFMFN